MASRASGGGVEQRSAVARRAEVDSGVEGERWLAEPRASSGGVKGSGGGVKWQRTGEEKTVSECEVN